MFPGAAHTSRLWSSRSAPRRVLLKTDTQGHDLDVLAGASTALGETHAVLTEAPVQPIYENVPRLTEIIAWLDSRGFSPSGLFAISHRPADLAIIEVDAHFTRRPVTQ